MRMMVEQQHVAVMVDKCTTMVANQIVSLGSITVDNSNGVARVNKTSSSKKANKMEHPVTENDGNNMEVWCTHAMSAEARASSRLLH